MIENMLEEKEKLERDIEFYKFRPIDIVESPLLNRFEWVREDKISLEESLLIRYSSSLEEKDLKLYNDSKLSLEEVTPVKSMVKDIETISLIFLLCDKEVCIEAKNFGNSEPFLENYLPYRQAVRTIQKTDYDVQYTSPYYIGTFNAINKLFNKLDKSTNFIAIPEDTVVKAYQKLNRNIDLNSFVIKANSDNIGLFKTFVGEEPNCNALPWLRVGPIANPPSPPVRSTQCGACFQFVPNKRAFEVLEV